MKLLIVDDDIWVIEGILVHLKKCTTKFDEILTANCYSEAVNIFQKQEIDLMLCDIEMPYGNGLHLYEWVKKNGYRTKCIFLTCHSEFDYAKQAISLHCFDYMLKPITAEKLDCSIRSAVESIVLEEKQKYYAEYGEKIVGIGSKFGTGNEDDQEIHSNRDRIKKVEQYILEHISEDMTVAELAEYIYISTNHLTRLFKKETGKTPIDYITAVRMSMAKELLEKGEMRVSDIALKTGYDNYSYFSKVFKKYYGESPRAYRRRCVVEK